MIELSVHKKRKTITRLVPEEWNELSPEQLVLIAALLFQEEDGTVIELQLVHILFGLTEKEMRIISEAQMDDLRNMVRWVRESCTLTKQLLPVLKVKGERLYGPKTALENMRFNEFAMTEIELAKWHSDMKNIEQLYRFVASIYRPGIVDYDTTRDPEGDIRVPFNQNTVEYYSRQLMKSLDIPTAVAITIWYKGCRQHLVNLFQELFSRKDRSVVESAEPNYFELIRAIARENIYGGFEAVENLFLYTALLEITTAIREQEEMEANNPKPEEYDEY